MLRVTDVCDEKGWARDRESGDARDIPCFENPHETWAPIDLFVACWMFSSGCFIFGACRTFIRFRQLRQSLNLG